MSSGFFDINKVTLESFSSDAVPSEFINKISKLSDDKGAKNSFIHTDNTKVQYTDPIPYIESLRNVQEKLSSLIDECDKKKEAFEISTERKEKEHFSNVISQSSEAADLKSKFSDLLLTVEKLNNNKIDPLGEKLKKASIMKDNASNISFLIKCYNHFYIHGEPPLELSADKQRANSLESAKVLSQLLKLSSKLSSDNQLPNGENAHTLILEFATTFESDQLKSFNTYYQSKNFARLQNITKTLFIYNNGINIVDFFVGGHPIFVQMQDNVKQEIELSYWKLLSDPTSTDYSLDNVSEELLEAVRETILSEIDSITTIFQENAKQALSSLIFKLLENIVKPRLKLICTTALAQSTLCYLRVLHLYHIGVTQMVFVQLRTVLLNKNIDLSFEFEKSYNTLFNEYLKDNSYFKLERENLESLIDTLISPFENANRDALKERKLSLKIEKIKNDEILEEEQSHEINEEDNNPYENYAGYDRPNTSSDLSTVATTHSNIDLYIPDTRVVKDKLKSARNYVSNSTKLKKITGITSFIKINEKYSLFDRYKSSLSSTSGANNGTTEMFRKSFTADTVTPEVKSLLSLKITQNIYKLVLESLTRSIELSPSQISIYTVELFKLTLYKIGPSYIAVGLESLYDTYVEAQSQKSVFGRGNTNIDLSFMSQFYIIFIQLFLLSTVVKKSFYPLVSTEHDTSFISHSFNAFLQDVEIGVNIIMKEVVDIVQDRIDTLLSKQSTNDYTTICEFDRTPTCESMVVFLENILNSALNELKFDSSLKMKFINKISNYFLSALILHLSQLKVTMDGFTVLTHDLAQYILIFNNIKLDTSDEYDPNGKSTDSKWVKDQLDQIQSAFKILNELPGLYSCQPGSLKEFCSEGKLNDLKKTFY
ncbi:Exocyst complex component 5 [Pichia californica]|nr:Exocyst complex component 5 [[Candida] californica]